MELRQLGQGETIKILVASLLVLRQKIHSFHWEVTGVSFLELHELFGEQYAKILEFADRVAEYLRTLDDYPPNTLQKILDSSLIAEVEDPVVDPWFMLAILEEDFGLLARYVEELPDYDRSLSNIADDLHEYLKKQQWFVRSYLR